MTNSEKVLEVWNSLKGKINQSQAWFLIGKKQIMIAKVKGVINNYWTVDLTGISYKKTRNH